MSWLSRLVVLLAALAVFLLAVVAVNQTQVALQFLAWQTPEISVFWWLLLAFTAGLALGFVWLAAASASRRLALRRLSRELASCQKELQELRNAPPPAWTTHEEV